MLLNDNHQREDNHLDLQTLKSYKFVVDVVGYTASGVFALVASWAKWKRRKNARLLALAGDSEETSTSDKAVLFRVETCEKGLHNLRSEVRGALDTQLEMHKDNRSRHEDLVRRQDDISRLIEDFRVESQRSRRVLNRRVGKLTKLIEEKSE